MPVPAAPSPPDPAPDIDAHPAYRRTFRVGSKPPDRAPERPRTRSRLTAHLPGDWMEYEPNLPV